MSLFNEAFTKTLKKAAVGVVLPLVMAVSAQAEPTDNVDPYTGEVTKGVKELCYSISGLADSVMVARLSGVPISDAMKIATEGENTLVNDLARGMVLDAYLDPIYTQIEYVDLYPSYFAAKHYVECIYYFEID